MVDFASPLCAVGATLTVSAVHLCVEHCAPRLGTRVHPVMCLHNGMYALASLVGVLYASAMLWPTVTELSFPESLYCRPPVGLLPNTDMDHLFLVYFLSKMWEAFDLVLVTLRGLPISLHFRVHHYTTPLFAWVFLQTRSAHGASFMWLNLLMHTMVYSWFAGVQHRFLLRAIRVWQYVQLLGGAGLALAAACTCPSSELPFAAGEVLPATLYLIYFVLFQLELREERVKQVE
jgi:hypothetical protein